MVNYLGEFTPTLATDSQKLRKVLGKECEWAWNVEHKDEFEYLKKLMATTPTLAYRLDSSTMLSTDASSYGLGTVIMQKHSPDAHCRPVAYASRALSTAEQRYAQIEKEALAFVGVVKGLITTWRSVNLLWKLIINCLYQFLGTRSSPSFCYVCRGLDFV